MAPNLTLFRPRTAPESEYAPEPWPEIGETWKPEGVIVSTRFLGVAGAVVLVYTADAGVNGTYYAVACLGCSFRTRTKDDTNYISTEQAGGEIANAHAAQCRALPRDLPTRPDDDTAREIVRRRLHSERRSDYDVTVYLTSFHLDRLVLQRSTEWIEEELQRLADDQPEFLTARLRSYGSSTEFTILRFPKS
ncbi:hypothetical protein [Streptomyces candidus]|uniref:Uncharacterized protein n=1 Tax=Streptomyces candidus TaxID=67283 RepID=A0A7X0LT45_9ACTN|nr:hypothetical protein [Streptomyces candidus]MBB6439094.1 hypothetical protein [Streptomyces candidus]GHH55617.1 hypothetical protein GCM10018773_60350 [Streptomyces candidus]